MRPSVEVAHIEGYRYGCADQRDTQPTLPPCRAGNTHVVGPPTSGVVSFFSLSRPIAARPLRPSAAYLIAVPRRMEGGEDAHTTTRRLQDEQATQRSRRAGAGCTAGGLFGACLETSRQKDSLMDKDSGTADSALHAR